MLLKIREVRARVEVSVKIAKAALEETHEDVEAAVQKLLLTYPAIARSAEAEAEAKAKAEEAARERIRWVAGRIGSYDRPNPLAPDSFGQALQELSQALVTIEGGGTTVFGLSLGADQQPELAALAPGIRESLTAWREHLVGKHGAEGAKAFDTIVARNGVSLPCMANTGYEESLRDEDGPTRAALTLLADTITREADLTQWWREQGHLDEADRVVRVRVGKPDPSALESFARKCEADLGRSLPISYLRFMARYQGIEADDASPPGDLAVVEPRRLGLPIIWPVQVYGDHFALEDTDVEGVGRAFVIGEISDLGSLVFDLAVEGESPIFWVPRRFAHETPTRIASSFTELIEVLCACRLSLRGVLRHAGVPGWGR